MFGGYLEFVSYKTELQRIYLKKVPKSVVKLGKYPPNLRYCILSSHCYHTVIVPTYACALSRAYCASSYSGTSTSDSLTPPPQQNGACAVKSEPAPQEWAQPRGSTDE